MEWIRNPSRRLVTSVTDPAHGLRGPLLDRFEPLKAGTELEKIPVHGGSPHALRRSGKFNYESYDTTG